MKIRILVLALIVSAVGAVPGAHARSAARPLTTEPSVYNDIDVTLTDSRIVLSEVVSQRGQGVNFHVKNVGKRVHNFTLLAQGIAIGLGHEGFSSGNLRTNQTAVVQIYLDYRGKFTYRSTTRPDRPKPGMHGTFTVT